MSVSIQTCPSCAGLLLGDSANCPHCGHVFDPVRAEHLPQSIQQSQGGSSPREKACSLCGEKVRAGLVRCWQCGTFMNSEMEDYYHKLQASPSPVIYSDNPESLLKPGASMSRPGNSSGGDDDFELKYDLLREADEVAAQQIEEDLKSRQSAETYPLLGGEEDSFTLGASSMMFIPTFDDAAPTISDHEYQLTQSSMMQFEGVLGTSGLEAEKSEEYALASPAVPAPALEVPEGWDAEQYYQYLREAMAWYEQLDATQKDEYAASVTEQTGLSFPPENVHLLYEPASETPGEAIPSGVASGEEVSGEAQGDSASEEGSDQGTAAPESSTGEDHHSVATGGDVLLAAAMSEQQELSRRPRGARIVSPGAAIPGTFIVYCPQGHRIQVKEKHRGQTGRCPNCKSLFHVPVAGASSPVVSEPAESVPAGPPGGYESWVQDLRLHVVQMTKLKLKPGSLQQDYETVDVGFSPEGLLVATVFKGGGSFRAAQEKKKKPESRAALQEHLKSGGPLSESPLPRTTLIPVDDLRLMRVVQPASPDEESAFAGVPVFGVGMIAVRIPATTDGGEKQYLSLMLSEFREFSRLLGEMYQLPPLGEGLGIPMEDTVAELKCGVSENRVSHLTGPLEFHKADTKMKLKPVAWKCAGCGVIISEEGRKKEKLGGKDGSSMPKSKCPKCKKKIGDQTFYGLG